MKKLRQDSTYILLIKCIMYKYILILIAIGVFFAIYMYKDKFFGFEKKNKKNQKHQKNKVKQNKHKKIMSEDSTQHSDTDTDDEHASSLSKGSIPLSENLHDIATNDESVSLGSKTYMSGYSNMTGVSGMSDASNFLDTE